MVITDEQAKELAEAHWEFLEKWLHMIYVDAGIHFFKHGYESRIKVFRKRIRELEEEIAKLRS